MRLLHSFEALHASVTRRWWMQLFVVFVRCLLALGFVPPSIPKIRGIPFTVILGGHPKPATCGHLKTGHHDG